MRNKKYSITGIKKKVNNEGSSHPVVIKVVQPMSRQQRQTEHKNRQPGEQDSQTGQSLCPEHKNRQPGEQDS